MKQLCPHLCPQVLQTLFAPSPAEDAVPPSFKCQEVKELGFPTGEHVRGMLYVKGKGASRSSFLWSLH
jgi:hypothetical protein